MTFLDSSVVSVSGGGMSEGVPAAVDLEMVTTVSSLNSEGVLSYAAAKDQRRYFLKI